MTRVSQPIDDEQALFAELLATGEVDGSIPRLARDRQAIERIEALVRARETAHELIHADARVASAFDENSVHLVVTSPPYWTLKRYNEHDEQLGHIARYDEFIAGLDEVWSNCYRALVPGGRLVIDVGDVCLSRRDNNGRRTSASCGRAASNLPGFSRRLAAYPHPLANIDQTNRLVYCGSITLGCCDGY